MGKEGGREVRRVRGRVGRKEGRGWRRGKGEGSGGREGRSGGKEGEEKG